MVKTTKTFVRGISATQNADYSWNVRIHVSQWGHPVEYDYFRKLSDSEYIRFVGQLEKSGWIVDLARVTNDTGIFVWVKVPVAPIPQVAATGNSKYDRMGW